MYTHCCKPVDAHSMSFAVQNNSQTTSNRCTGYTVERLDVGDINSRRWGYDEDDDDQWDNMSPSRCESTVCCFCCCSCCYCFGRRVIRHVWIFVRRRRDCCRWSWIFGPVRTWHVFRLSCHTCARPSFRHCRHVNNWNSFRFYGIVSNWASFRVEQICRETQTKMFRQFSVWSFVYRLADWYRLADCRITWERYLLKQSLR